MALSRALTSAENVTDQAGSQTYAATHGKLIRNHGSRYLVRGGKVTAAPPLRRA